MNLPQSASRRISRLLLHHLLHPFLHFFRSRFGLMCAYHPGVAVRIDDGADAIAPKHIHDRALAGRAEFCGFLNDLVYILDIEVQSRR
jgi:hypothetical protein